MRLGGTNSSHTVLDTVRIPLEDFTGSMTYPSEIQAIRIDFNQNSRGLVGIDEIQFMQW